MKTSDRRLVAGLLAGVLVGALGPVMTAVANHSGNRSGSEPLALSVTAEQTITARATWSSGGHTFTLDVHRDARATASADTAHQLAEHTDTGTIDATGYICVGPYYDRVCGERTWHGVLGSAYSDGNWIESDPTLSYARAVAWMRADGEDQRGHPMPGCRFTVEWFGEGDMHPSESEHASVGLHGADAGAQRSFVRDARASVIADCWNANADNEWDSGTGSLERTIAVETAAKHHLDDAHPPFCEDLGVCR